jgi:serine/threonine-protein kinase
MADTQLADELIGTLVDGRYRVRERLARGGMATVYTAVDERLERTVAMKIVHPSQATEPLFVDRFIEEARAIARLTHPNVVAAYDQGNHDGLPYLVMEYVRGRTLREILRSRRRLTPVEALSITEQMLAAIAAAHRAGLVHRDVKPENVLVAEAPSGGTTNLVDSVIKVTDFGLAQAVQASTDAAGAAADGGVLMATMAYVAPELVTDGRADPRSDVYSTGIVLFEMLTGRLPYDGEPTDIAWRHVEEDVPPPSRYVAGLPPAVDDLVIRATRRERADRPSDAGALLTDVQAAREQVTTSAVRPRSADQTVVMSTMPPVSAPAGDRPAWARLPAGRAGQPATARWPASRRAATLGAQTRLARRAGPDQAARRQVIMFSFVGALVLLLAVAGWWLGIGRWMPAPELVGLPEAEAVALAQQEGLRVAFAEPRHHEQVTAGHVLAQSPDGRVLKGGTLTLTLSLGPEVFLVPDIVGADLEVAVRQLESLGLVVVHGEPDYSDTVPEGRVMRVDPAVGEQLLPGAPVTVTVSRGKAPVEVPSLIGMTVEAARNELASRNLAVEVEEVQDNAPAGQVLSQDPAPGSGAEPGDTVRLQVSQGPPTQPVPEVRGQPCDSAEQILIQAGFEVRVIEVLQRGTVSLQNPSAGTGLPRGSQVTIWCGPAG